MARLLVGGVGRAGSSRGAHGARAERSDFQITLERDLDPGAGQAELYPQEITRALLNMISQYQGRLGEWQDAVTADEADSFVDDVGRPAYLDPSGATPFPAEYPVAFHSGLPALAGYVHYTDEVPGSPGGFYAVTARHRFNSRGMPVESLPGR